MTEWPWKNFTRSELQCKETGECNMIPSFMTRLQLLRREFGKPMPVSSGFRSKNHSAERKKIRPGTHAMGCAVDIKVHGSDAYRLVNLAQAYGFTGIGVKQHSNPAYRFIHLDDAPNTQHRPRPWIWSYK